MRPPRRPLPWVLGALALIAALAALLLLRTSTPAADPEPAAGPDTPAPAPASPSGASDERPGRTAPSRTPDEASPDEAPVTRAPLRLSAARVTRDEGAGPGTIAGRVIAWATGSPVAGAELSFEHRGATLSVRSDREGRYVFVAPEPGWYSLAVAEAEGFLPFAPAWGHSPIRVRAEPGVRIDGVTVFLIDEVAYRGRVVDLEGGPVAGASVRVLGAASGDLTLSPVRDTYRSGADGGFTFAAPDGAILEGSHPEHGVGRARVDLAVQVSHELTLRLDPAAASSRELAIGGRVLAQGEPLADALVVAEPTGPASPDRLTPPASTTSHPDGAFRLGGLDEGGYDLQARAEGYATATREAVPAGTEDLTLELEEEARLRVRASAGGEPVASFSVIVERAVGPIAREVVAVQSGYAADGAVEVGGLGPGPHEVTVAAPDHASTAAMPVILRAGTTAELSVELGAGGHLVGRVVDAETSAALANARVTVERRIGRGASAVPVAETALSGEDGAFALDGVAPGLRSVAVWAADHHGRIRSGLVVEPGRTLDLGTVDLTPVEEGERPQLELAGIGAVLVAEGDGMVIQRVIDGGGAAEAGLAPGDAILEVAGEPVTALGFGGSIEAIRGPEGTTVQLEVRRASGVVERVRVPRRRIRA